MAGYKVSAKEAKDLWDKEDHLQKSGYGNLEKEQAKKALESADTAKESVEAVYERKDLLNDMEIMLQDRKEVGLDEVIKAGKQLKVYMDSHFQYGKDDKSTVKTFLEGVQEAYGNVIDACETFRSEREPWTVEGKQTRSLVGAFEIQAKAQKDFFERTAVEEKTEDYFAGLGRDTLRAGVENEELVDGAFLHEENISATEHWDSRTKRLSEEYMMDRLHDDGNDPNRKRNIDAMWKTTGRLAMEDVFLDSSIGSLAAARTYQDLKKAQSRRGLAFAKSQTARRDEVKIRLIHYLLSDATTMSPHEFLYDWKGGDQKNKYPVITHITARTVPALSGAMDSDSARQFLLQIKEKEMLMELLQRDLLGLLESAPLGFAGYEAVVNRLRAIYGIIGSTS